MDNEILEILKQIQKEQQEMKSDIKNINIKVDRIEKKLDAVAEQTANLTEFKTDTTEKLDKLINVTKDNCYEISNLKIVK